MPSAWMLLLQQQLLSRPRQRRLSPCSRPRISPWGRSTGFSSLSSRRRGEASTRRRGKRGRATTTMSEKGKSLRRRRWSKASQRIDLGARGPRRKRPGRASWLLSEVSAAYSVVLSVSARVERGTNEGNGRVGCSLPPRSLEQKSGGRVFFFIFVSTAKCFSTHTKISGAALFLLKKKCGALSRGSRRRQPRRPLYGLPTRASPASPRRQWRRPPLRLSWRPRQTRRRRRPRQRNRQQRQRRRRRRCLRWQPLLLLPPLPLLPLPLLSSTHLRSDGEGTTCPTCCRVTRTKEGKKIKRTKKKWCDRRRR